MISIKNAVVAYLFIVAFTAMSAPNPAPKAFLEPLLNLLKFNPLGSKKEATPSGPGQVAQPNPAQPDGDTIKDKELTFEEIKKLTPAEIKLLTDAQKKAVTEEQRKELSEEQRAALG